LAAILAPVTGVVRSVQPPQPAATIAAPASLPLEVNRASKTLHLGYLGAERYLEAGTVAVLLTLRQNLIAEIRRPATADMMIIDTAVVAYYNFLRVQRWIGELSLIFEREAFGQAALNEIHGPELGERLREQLERLSEVILPLQDRCHRMMIRSLAQLSLKRGEIA
jgi:hypothetical protein